MCKNQYIYEITVLIVRCKHLKVTRNISLDPDVVQAVDLETERGEFCLSKYINNMLKIRLKDVIKKK